MHLSRPLQCEQLPLDSVQLVRYYHVGVFTTPCYKPLLLFASPSVYPRGSPSRWSVADPRWPPPSLLSLPPLAPLFHRLQQLQVSSQSTAVVYTQLQLALLLSPATGWLTFVSLRPCLPSSSAPSPSPDHLHTLSLTYSAHGLASNVNLNPSEFPALGAVGASTTSPPPPPSHPLLQQQQPTAAAAARMNGVASSPLPPAASQPDSHQQQQQQQHGLRSPSAPSTTGPPPGVSLLPPNQAQPRAVGSTATSAVPSQQQQGGAPLQPPVSLAPQTPAEQVLFSPADRYGLLGLLHIIKTTDPDMSMLALGSDLTTLGLDLGATE